MRSSGVAEDLEGASFARLRRVVRLTDIWVLKQKERVVGYALAREDQTMLTISNQVLRKDTVAAEAVATFAAELKPAYVQVKINRPSEIASLRSAGFDVAHPTWESFMVKPLVPEVTVEDAKQLYGIGTDRFLISWLDVT